MEQVDTLHVGRYWSEILCCTITTHLGDLEVKVTDLVLSFGLKDFISQGHGSYISIDLVPKHKSGELRCPATALILTISCTPMALCLYYVKVNISGYQTSNLLDSVDMLSIKLPRLYSP